MDELDRDRFYSLTSPKEDEGEEYELEPPDPEVLANEQRQAEEAIEASRHAIDIDQIYRDMESQHADQLFSEWIRDFRFRFQVKHLLVATAVLAVVLALWQLGMLRHALAVGIMVAVFGVYAYIEWREKRRRDEADRRREEMYARRRLAAKQVPAPKDADPAVDTSWLDEKDGGG